jgi:hypothetical protein
VPVGQTTGARRGGVERDRRRSAFHRALPVGRSSASTAPTRRAADLLGPGSRSSAGWPRPTEARPTRRTSSRARASGWSSRRSPVPPG